MEGIGYWIFLLALYLISTLAKKAETEKCMGGTGQGRRKSGRHTVKT
jgi:hypothetical protein